MVRNEDLEILEQKKQTKERVEYASQQVVKLIKEVAGEIGEGIKFTVDGKVVLPKERKFSEEPDDMIQAIEKFSTELANLIEQGGVIPQEFLIDGAK